MGQDSEDRLCGCWSSHGSRTARQGLHCEYTVGDRPALETLKHADRYKQRADDPGKAEYFVRVAWLDTVPESKAVNELGLFGNQNTVCQPTTPKWRHTVDRLKTYFPKWDNKAG